MRAILFIVCLLLASIAGAATPSVVVDLGATPATPRTYSAQPGDFEFKLTNVVPNKTYEIVGDDRDAQAKIAVVEADTAVKCEATPAQVRRILDAILDEKKSKAPEGEKDSVKVTEADIAAALEGDLGCVERSKLDADKTKIEDELTKTASDLTKAGTDITAAEEKIKELKKKLANEYKAETEKQITEAEAEHKKLVDKKTELEAQQKDLTAKKAAIEASATHLTGLEAKDPDLKKLDDEIAKLTADKAKTGADVAALDKQIAEKQTERTRIANERIAPRRQAIRDLFTITFDDFTLKEGGAVAKTFKAAGEEKTWPVVVTEQGGSAAVTAKAAQKAASPLASDSPILDRLLLTTAEHPQRVARSCKFTDASCPEVYINADQNSTLTITDIEQRGPVTVRITGGEYFPCQAVRYNIARYESTPDTLILPLQMKKGWFGIGNVGIDRAEAEAADIYGLDWCPGENRVIQKRGLTRRDQPQNEYERDVLARLNAQRLSNGTVYIPADATAESTSAKAANANDGDIELSQLKDPRVENFKSPPIASIPLFLRGKSQVVEVQFAWENGTSKTFTFPVIYQRFWLDAGGFFAFSRRTDQSIELRPVAESSPERQKVIAVHRVTSIEPNTGIVINVHPGNFPIMSFQFGIAANQGRLPSFYGGLGLRAREIGKRGLATLGIGVAMQQEQQFPNVQIDGEYASTDPILKPTNKYGLTFPYISISLGFSFGGVSEKTNVADSPETQ